MPSTTVRALFGTIQQWAPDQWAATLVGSNFLKVFKTEGEATRYFQQQYAPNPSIRRFEFEPVDTRMTNVISVTWAPLS